MENAKVWYYLDPDNNKPTPDVPHCCRCKKKLKDGAGMTFVCVEIHAFNPWVRRSIYGRDLIGEDCWNKIVKEGEVKL